MLRLLYLEDEGLLRNQTVHFLREDGYEVKAFGRIDLATDYLEQHPDEIDCIITDLNMNDEWLGEYQAESNGCLFSGWVWLHRFVFSNDKYRKIHCIIYSGYIIDLKKFLAQKRETYLLNENNVCCIQKGGYDDSGYTALINKLKRFEKVFNGGYNDEQ